MVVEVLRWRSWRKKQLQKHIQSGDIVDPTVESLRRSYAGAHCRCSIFVCEPEAAGRTMRCVTEKIWRIFEPCRSVYMKLNSKSCVISKLDAFMSVEWMVFLSCRWMFKARVNVVVTNCRRAAARHDMPRPLWPWPLTFRLWKWCPSHVWCKGKGSGFI